MKSYLSLIPISAKVRRRQNRMTLLCIIFSVFLVTGIFSMANAFLQTETDHVKESGGNWHINLEGISQEDAASIAQRPEVSASAWFDMVNMEKDRAYTIQGIQTALAGAEESFRTDVMTYFPQDADLSPGEAILTPNAKTLLGVEAGDRVTLDTPAGSYPFLVTGFRSDSSRYDSGSGFGESTALPLTGEQVGVFLDWETYRTILDENQDTGAPAYYVQFCDRANIRRALKEIKAQFPEAEVHENMILLAAVGASENRMAKNVYPAAGAVCLLVLLAGVLMISGSLNSSIAQRTQFFGMMRCIGMSKKQVKRFVELEALNWCKIAIPLGVLLGTSATWLLSAFLRYYVGGEFSGMRVLSVSPVGILSGVVAGTLTVLLAARAPAKKAAKVSPVAAVSGSADAENRAHQAKPGLLRIETALGVSHAASSKKSLFLMAGSFALSILLFLSFSVLAELLGIMLPTKSYSSDIDIYSESEELSLTISPELIPQMEAMPGVERVFGRQGAVHIPARFSAAVDRDEVAQLISFDDIQLDWIPGDDDLRKGGDLEKVYGDQGCVLCVWDKDVPLTVGDKVQLCGSEVEIAGMMTSNPFSNDGRTDGDVILICSEETFHRLTGEDNYTILSVQLTPEATDEDVEALHDLVRGQYEFSDRRGESDRSTFYAFSLFLYGFLAVIALITVLNIVNSISMSVSARTRQYGAMRAVGMDGGQLTRMIAAEAGTYALTGCIIGCGAGLPLSRFLYGKLITSHFPYYTWTLPLPSMAVILLFVLAATLAAVYAPSKRIRNMAVTETINEL